MAKQKHKVWKVRIGSLDDEELRDRQYHRGKRWITIAKLPERAAYLIEAKGQGRRAKKKALQMAADEGITRPVMLSIEWVNCPLRVR